MMKNGIGNQISKFAKLSCFGEQWDLDNLTPFFLFAIFFNLLASNKKCKIIFDVYALRVFQWYIEGLIWTKFTLYTFFSNIQELAPQKKLLFEAI
jgi:hypothetical protein